MHVFRSLCSAFLMYSKIPMPKVEWKEENRRYALCFFPLIGVVIGGLLLLTQWFCTYYKVNQFLFAAVAVWIPLSITGGIHMDGYMDVTDATSSMGDRAHMLDVMKDSRVGAFAVIHAVMYLLLQMALFFTVTRKEIMCVLAFSFVQSRAYSALAAVTFQNANKEGSLWMFCEPAHKKITVVVELVILALCWCGMIYVSVIPGLCGLVCGLVCFLYYYRFSYKYFGGITGDLAGWFLQISEIISMAGIVFAGCML